MAKKAILYINQFFGQIGGEEMAHIAPELHEGLVGPAAIYQKCLGSEVVITHTIICGDNYMGSDPQKAVAEIISMVEGLEFDLFFAGPAFMAGRYGTACGNICKAVSKKFGVSSFTSMNEENPGVEMFQEDMYIFKGAKSAAKMRQDVAKICTFALKFARGGSLLPAEEEGYFGRRFRKEIFTEKAAYNRAVDMLLDVLAGRPYITEMPMYVNDIPKPLPAIDLKKARIALVTTGGIVPKDNPDRIQSASATVWGKYNISKLDSMPAGDFICIHSGFDNHEANANINIVLPLDVMRQMEKEGLYASLHPYYYVTTGTGTAQSAARKMAREIADDMLASHVDGVVFVST